MGRVRVKNNRRVLCADGIIRTFTQRGKTSDEGFVRVNGKTVTGWVYTPFLSPDRRRRFIAFSQTKSGNKLMKNGNLITPRFFRAA